MSKRISYNYKIELIYEYNNKSIILDHKNIKSVTIDYDYNDKNMPIFLLNLILDKSIIDDLIENSGKKEITMNISKCAVDSKLSIYEDYIKSQFIFIADKEKNKNKNLDYNSENILNSKNDQKIYDEITIGLVDINIINNNKKLINGIFENTSIANIIYYFSSHMNMVVEPIYIHIPKSFIIPPMDSFTKFIKYLNDSFVLYKHGYRLFYDLDRTYILGNSGNGIKCKDDIINTILINIHSNTNDKSKLEGIEIIPDRNLYSIDVGSSDVNTLYNKATNLSFNKTVYINNSGENNCFEATDNDRIRLLKTNKSDISNIDINTYKDEIINVFKSNLDSSIFTINKEYFIKNYNDNIFHDGKYILIRKKEIYIKQNNNFNIFNILTFKKVIS